MEKMLFKPLASLKNQIKPSSSPTIDNQVFKLHYRVTGLMLLTCLVIVCAREYLGDQIKCDSGKEQEKFQAVINNYCLIMGSFTVERLFNESLVRSGQALSLGVGHYDDAKDRIITYKYYQWTPFILFAQALSFYLPHLIWKGKEGGRIKALVDGLQNWRLAFGDAELDCKAVKVPAKGHIRNRLEFIRKDIVLRLHVNRTWSTWLVSMEVLNLAQLVLQVYLLDLVLGGRFIPLGTSDQMQLAKTFPLMTKCKFNSYGKSGSVQNHDSLCVMSMNLVHQMVFVTMWYWFLALFAASILAIFWRLFTYICCRWHSQLSARLLARSSNLLPPHSLATVVQACTYSDWLFLRYLGRNMDGLLFKELLTLLVEELEVNKVGFRDGAEAKRLL